MTAGLPVWIEHQAGDSGGFSILSSLMTGYRASLAGSGTGPFWVRVRVGSGFHRGIKILETRGSYEWHKQ